MKKNDKETIKAGFYLDRSSLTYFDHQTEQLTSISLTSEVIQDLEIVSQPALERVIKSWLDQTKIVPGHMMLIVSQSVFYSQTLSTLPSKKDDPQVVAFLDLVPFEEIKTNIFPLQKGALIMAQNQLLLDPVVETLEKLGFKVLSVLGGFAIGLAPKLAFSVEKAKFALDNFDALNNFNVLTPEEVAQKATQKEVFLAVKFDKKLILMIVVFVVLLSLLGGLLFLQKR
jgi:hypothetical protein